MRRLVMLAVALAIVAAHMPPEHYQRMETPRDDKKAQETVAEFESLFGKGKPIVPTPHKYKTKGGPIPGKFNIHIVPHTHVRGCFIIVVVARGRD